MKKICIIEQKDLTSVLDELHEINELLNDLSESVEDGSRTYKRLVKALIGIRSIQCKLREE